MHSGVRLHVRGLTRHALGSLQEMMKRISKSAPLAQWNAAMLKLRSLEAEIGRAKDDKAIEVWRRGEARRRLWGEPQSQGEACKIALQPHAEYCS